MRRTGSRSTVTVAIIGGLIFLLILTIGTVLTGFMATKDTTDAVESVSLYKLEKFAFVDEDGLIYTSLGNQTNIDEYNFDYRTISGPEISILNLNTSDKKVIIAVPVDDKTFEGKTFAACFMEIDMTEMLEGVSVRSEDSEATFCNIYTRDGVALTDMVLGGLASEDNLLEAFENANYREGFISFIDPENIRDGLEATRKIRAMTREDCAKIPIFALTANAFDEDVQRSLQAGLNAHLSKPIQQEVLFETWESLIKPCDADTEGGAG